MGVIEDLFGGATGLRALDGPPVARGDLATVATDIPPTRRRPPMQQDELVDRPAILPMAHYESGYVRPAVPSVLRDMFDAAMAPGRAYQGEAAPTPEMAAQMALEWGPGAVASSRAVGDVGTLGTFAGRSARPKSRPGKVFLAEDGTQGDAFATAGRRNPIVSTREEAAEAARELLVEQDPYFATRPAPRVRWDSGKESGEPGWVAIPPKDLRVEPFVVDAAGVDVDDPALEGLYAEPRAMAEELARRGYDLIRGRWADDGYAVIVRKR